MGKVRAILKIRGNFFKIRIFFFKIIMGIFFAQEGSILGRGRGEREEEGTRRGERGRYC